MLQDARPAPRVTVGELVVWFPISLFPGWLQALSAYAPTHRFARLGTAVSEGHAPGAGAIIVLTAWLVLFGSYAVLSYRRRAGTI